MSTTTYAFSYIQERVIREGIVTFTLADGTTTPCHADLFLESNKYSSSILAKSVNDTFGEANRIIPVPDCITPAALDYYLCKLYKDSTTEFEEGRDAEEVLAFYYSVAKLYRWADVSAFEELDKKIDCMLGRWAWNSNEHAFHSIGRAEEFYQEMPLAYAQCVDVVKHVLVKQYASPDNPEASTNLFASSDAFNLSSRTCCAVMSTMVPTIVKSIRAAFNLYYSRSQDPKLNEKTFMERWQRAMNPEGQGRKRNRLSYQLKSYHLTFQLEREEAAGHAGDPPMIVRINLNAAGGAADAEPVEPDPWQKLVVIDKPTYLECNAGGTSGPSNFCGEFNLNLETTVLALSDSAVRLSKGSMLVSIAAKGRSFAKKLELGKFYDVKVSFKQDGVLYSSTVSTCLTGHFQRELPHPPNINEIERRFLSSYLKPGMEVFQLQCDADFLQRVCTVNKQDIKLEVTVEVSHH